MSQGLIIAFSLHPKGAQDFLVPLDRYKSQHLRNENHKFEFSIVYHGSGCPGSGWPGRVASASCAVAKLQCYAMVVGNAALRTAFPVASSFLRPDELKRFIMLKN